MYEDVRPEQRYGDRWYVAVCIADGYSREHTYLDPLTAEDYADALYANAAIVRARNTAARFVNDNDPED